MTTFAATRHVLSLMDSKPLNIPKMRLRLGLERKRICGVIGAQGTCLVAVAYNVVQLTAPLRES